VISERESDWSVRQTTHLVTTFSVCGTKAQYGSKFSLYVTDRSYMSLSNFVNFMIASSGLLDTSCSSQRCGSYRPTKFVSSYKMFRQV